MSTILMKCGCTALALDKDGKPVCPVHIGIHEGARLVDENAPSLDGRTAYCCYCKQPQPSNFALPFFSIGRWYRGTKNEMEDEYYCGCRGWE